jgi:hypothetical protein
MGVPSCGFYQTAGGKWWIIQDTRHWSRRCRQGVARARACGTHALGSSGARAPDVSRSAAGLMLTSGAGLGAGLGVGKRTKVARHLPRATSLLRHPRGELIQSALPEASPSTPARLLTTSRERQAYTTRAL